MEKRVRRTFTNDFKVQAVELAQAMGSIAEAAEKLGIDPERISQWKSKIAPKAGDRRTPAEIMADAEEIKRLKKQVSELEKTNYILKRAAAFFSQDHLK
jgi:transposase